MSKNPFDKFSIRWNQYLGNLEFSKKNRKKAWKTGYRQKYFLKTFRVIDRIPLQKLFEISLHYWVQIDMFKTNLKGPFLNRLKCLKAHYNKSSWSASIVDKSRIKSVTATSTSKDNNSSNHEGFKAGNFEFIYSINSICTNLILDIRFWGRMFYVAWNFKF